MSRAVLIEALITSVLMAAVTLIASAGFLRRSEIEADRQAVRWLGSSEPLSRLLHAGGPPVSTERRRWWLQLLARHPSLAARVAALQDPTSTHDVGPDQHGEPVTPVSPADEHSQPVTAVSLVDGLTKLVSMLESGALTREEFDGLKARLLGE